MVGTVGGWVLGVCVCGVTVEGGPLGMSCPLFPSSLYVPPISYNDQFPPVGSAQDIVAVTLHYLPSFALGCHGRIITRKGRIQRHSGIWASSTRRHTRLLLAIYDQALLIFASVTHSVRIKDLFDLTRTWVGSPRHLLAVPTTMRKGSGIYLLFLS